MKKCTYNKHGGGYGMGAPLVPFDPANDQSFSIKMPVNQSFSDCAFPARPGQLDVVPRPDLAQVGMAGGRRNSNRHRTQRKKGGAQSEYYPVNGADTTYKVELPITQGFPNCSGVDVPSRIMEQAHPELAQTPMAGGKRTRKTRKARNLVGGTRGFSVDPWNNVGGNGPNAGAANVPVPCDPRAGSFNFMSHTPIHPDIRAPYDVYSLTANKMGGSYKTCTRGGNYKTCTRGGNYKTCTRGGSYKTCTRGGSYKGCSRGGSYKGCSRGGSYSQGNGYSDECYAAPGSYLPKYEAETAGFTFRPSTERGGTLPDGITAYMNVVPQAARMGGARNTFRTRKHRRS